jgi:hypothetical protein
MVSLCTAPVFIQTKFGAISQTEPAAKITNVDFRRFVWRSLTLKSKAMISPALLGLVPHTYRIGFIVAVQVYFL